MGFIQAGQNISCNVGLVARFEQGKNRQRPVKRLIKGGYHE